MPLFTIPKKPVLNNDLIKDDKIIKEEIKTFKINDFKAIKEDYAILGSNNFKFYFIIYQIDKSEPNKNITYSYLPDNQELENKKLCELFALKVLIEYLKTYGIKVIKIYSHLTLDDINKYSEIKNVGSMFRYKSSEILSLLNEYPVEINFINIEENQEIKEMVENENKV